MPDEFTTSAFIPALPMAVYMAWLDGSKHGEMTGADAHIDASRGGAYDAWDGYIHGTTLELDPGRRIVQRWRTAEFPGDAPDSTIELTLEPQGNGTRLKIKHTGIPEGQGKLYESGWLDHYFRPMQEYFIHAGISGVPHGATVTEILHRVSIGEATPSSPSLPVFREQSDVGIVENPDVADASQPAAPVEVIEDSAPVTSGEFDLADEVEQDDFDTEVAKGPDEVAEPKTTTQDFWKHLATPAIPAAAQPKPAPLPAAETAGRRPARRAPAGAGKAAKSSGRRAGLKPAARPNKKPLAAKSKAKATKNPASNGRGSKGKRPKSAKAKPKAKAKKRNHNPAGHGRGSKPKRAKPTKAKPKSKKRPNNPAGNGRGSKGKRPKSAKSKPKTNPKPKKRK